MGSQYCTITVANLQHFMADSGLPCPLYGSHAWHDVCYTLHVGEQDSLQEVRYAKR